MTRDIRGITPLETHSREGVVRLPVRVRPRGGVRDEWLYVWQAACCAAPVVRRDSCKGTVNNDTAREA